jgi:alkylhydroperoxidase family enzyme
MAYIDYLDSEEISERDRVADNDNIIRIHGVHSRVIRLHHDLYRELMYGPGPLTRIQREMVAVVVSAANDCHY